MRRLDPAVTAFVVVWLLSSLVSLLLLALGAWAVIELVQWVTSK